MGPLMIVRITAFCDKIQHGPQDNVEVFVDQLTLVYRNDRHEMLFPVHPQRHWAVLLHIAKGVFHLVSVSVSVRSRLDIQKRAAVDILSFQQPPYLAGFVGKLFFIWHALISASAAQAAVSANFHIANLHIHNLPDLPKIFHSYHKTLFYTPKIGLLR